MRGRFSTGSGGARAPPAERRTFRHLCPPASPTRAGSPVAPGHPKSRASTRRQPRGASMTRHHLRFVLRQWIEHQNPANLRLHVWSNGAAWLGLTTALSQVPVPVAVPLLGPSVGAWFVALSVLYWAPADPLTAVLVGLMSIGWAHLPVTLWGPG